MDICSELSLDEFDSEVEDGLELEDSTEEVDEFDSDVDEELELEDSTVEVDELDSDLSSSRRLRRESFLYAFKR